MIGFKKALVDYKDKQLNVKVELCDNNTYAIKGVGSTSLHLDSGTIFHIELLDFVICKSLLESSHVLSVSTIYPPEIL